MSYIDTLIANCKKAQMTRPLKEFIVSDIEDLNGIQCAIYIIEEIGGDPELTFADFKDYKSTKQRACSRLNAPSKTMYVGSSTTDVKKRISQHLGNGHRLTYALHLNEWFKGEYKITVRQYDTTPEVIQIIEDALSHKLKPAFGKQGGNNK